MRWTCKASDQTLRRVARGSFDAPCLQNPGPQGSRPATRVCHARLPPGARSGTMDRRFAHPPSPLGIGWSSRQASRGRRRGMHFPLKSARTTVDGVRNDQEGAQTPGRANRSVCDFQAFLRWALPVAPEKADQGHGLGLTFIPRGLSHVLVPDRWGLCLGRAGGAPRGISLAGLQRRGPRSVDGLPMNGPSARAGSARSNPAEAGAWHGHSSHHWVPRASAEAGWHHRPACC